MVPERVAEYQGPCVTGHHSGKCAGLLERRIDAALGAEINEPLAEARHAIEPPVLGQDTAKRDLRHVECQPPIEKRVAEAVLVVAQAIRAGPVAAGVARAGPSRRDRRVVVPE